MAGQETNSKKILNSIKLQGVHIPVAALAPVQISYREEGKRIHGAFYDHFLLRAITRRETEILLRDAGNIDGLQEFIRESSLSLDLYGNAEVTPDISANQDSGLLFIPGKARKSNDPERDQFENALIKQAQLSGRPVLAVCAGACKLWEMSGGRLRDVTDHVYSSMPYICTGKKTLGDVGNNKMVHQVRFELGTVMSSLVTAVTQQVNSVHWNAPDETAIPAMLVVNAYSQQDPSIGIHNRQKKLMAPEEDTIEGFETKFGVLMLGTVWHIEAFYKMNGSAQLPMSYQQSIAIINYMAKAGDAYNAKKNMLNEFKKVTSDLFKPASSDNPAHVRRMNAAKR